jgi:hypothetical protein
VLCIFVPYFRLESGETCLFTEEDLRGDDDEDDEEDDDDDDDDDIEEEEDEEAWAFVSSESSSSTTLEDCSLRSARVSSLLASSKAVLP